MGNLYVRFDEGEGSAKSRPSLLYCSDQKKSIKRGSKCHRMTDRARLSMQIFDRSHVNNPSEHADKSHGLTVAWDHCPERMDF
jgi:hypothetical protein